MYVVNQLATHETARVTRSPLAAIDHSIDSIHDAGNPLLGIACGNEVGSAFSQARTEFQVSSWLAWLANLWVPHHCLQNISTNVLCIPPPVAEQEPDGGSHVANILAATWPDIGRSSWNSSSLAAEAIMPSQSQCTRCIIIPRIED